MNEYYVSSTILNTLRPSINHTRYFTTSNNTTRLEESVSQSIIHVMLYSGTCWLVRSLLTHLAVATIPQPHLHQFNVMLRAVYE